MNAPASLTQTQSDLVSQVEQFDVQNLSGEEIALIAGGTAIVNTI